MSESRPKVLISDLITGEKIVREMNDQEFASYEARWAAINAQENAETL